MLDPSNRIISWKGYDFPISITSFSLTEDAKVATYEYAGRNGAEHERVLNYRVLNISGIFSSTSSPDGKRSPSYYVKMFKSLNDNNPGILKHPTFGFMICILKRQKFTEVADENEAYRKGGKQIILPNFAFELEFWEHTDPTEATVSQDILNLFPGANPKPANDKYETNLKYKTVNELYQALVDGKIISGTDPIRNAEWLRYDYAFRLEAWKMWQANPTGAGTKTVISTSKQNTYTVVSGDTGMKIAMKHKVPFTSLYQANQGRDVRKNPRGKEGKRWKTAATIYPGDVLIIPSL